MEQTLEQLYLELVGEYTELESENRQLKLALATAQEDARQQRDMKIKAREQRDRLVQQIKESINYDSN